VELSKSMTGGHGMASGRSAARLARLLREQEVGSSNLPAPTTTSLFKSKHHKKLSPLAWLFSLSVFLLAPTLLLAGDPASYQVQPGDNLSVIAARYGVRVADIKQANRLSGDLIMVGQELRIPDPFRLTRPRDVRWERPLRRNGPVLRPFGPYKVNGVLMPRTGTAVACPWGTRIHSPANGVIRHIGHMDGFGTLMIIEHGGGYATVLSPFAPDSIDLQEDQAVNRGTLLGKSGRPDELRQEPFVHLELRKNEKAIKPDRLLK
jgi:murein DD-endopeptidase MepM/ murein hydrolase activator NlpD